MSWTVFCLRFPHSCWESKLQGTQTALHLFSWWWLTLQVGQQRPAIHRYPTPVPNRPYVMYVISVKGSITMISNHCPIVSIMTACWNSPTTKYQSTLPCNAWGRAGNQAVSHSLLRMFGIHVDVGLLHLTPFSYIPLHCSNKNQQTNNKKGTCPCHTHTTVIVWGNPNFGLIFFPSIILFGLCSIITVYKHIPYGLNRSDTLVKNRWMLKCLTVILKGFIWYLMPRQLQGGTCNTKSGHQEPHWSILNLPQIYTPTL